MIVCHWAEQGWLRLFLMRGPGGEIVAFQYTRYRGVVISLFFRRLIFTLADKLHVNHGQPQEDLHFMVILLLEKPVLMREQRNEYIPA